MRYYNFIGGPANMDRREMRRIARKLDNKIETGKMPRGWTLAQDGNTFTIIETFNVSDPLVFVYNEKGKIVNKQKKITNKYIIEIKEIEK